MGHIPWLQLWFNIIETTKIVMYFTNFLKDFLIVLVPAIIAIATWYLNEQKKLSWEKWKMKKEACGRALDTADAILSNYKYSNLESGIILPDKSGVSTREARRIVNSLTCSCDSGEVLIIFKKIIVGPVTPDVILDLRNAVRKELGFGKKVIDEDRKHAFIAKLGADPEAQQ